MKLYRQEQTDKGRLKKKHGLFNDIDQKSLLLEALEIVTCHWGGWVSNV